MCDCSCISADLNNHQDFFFGGGWGLVGTVCTVCCENESPNSLHTSLPACPKWPPPKAEEALRLRVASASAVEWLACALADVVPVTVLIPDQLQVFHWRLPVSVPFANFSSQDRHKMRGTPAAVHSNPVTSSHVSESHVGRQAASVWARFGVSTQETLAHGAGEAMSFRLLLHGMWVSSIWVKLWNVSSVL